MEKTTCYVYVGLPASGKTYLAYEEHGEDAVIIDSDEVRARLLGNACDQTQNARVFDHMYKETCACLEKGVSVAYVATNINAKRRINFVKNLRAKFHHVRFVCCVVVAPIDLCHERNSMRERSVPTYVIDRMLRSFDPPCENEGWDEILIKYNFPKENTLGGDVESYRTFYHQMVEDFGSQGNEHHILTLAGHCKKCGDLAYDALKHKNERATDDDFTRDEVDIIFAAYFHDYGKALTKTYWSKDGGKNAHYPNHAEVGSYLSLTMGYNLHTAQLIRWHMVPYTSAREQEVWHTRLGDKLWNEIMILHSFDEGAH